MEDPKLVHASGHAQETGTRHSPDSGTTSNFVPKKDGQQCILVDSSRRFPSPPRVSASPKVAELPSLDVSPGKHDELVSLEIVDPSAADKHVIPGDSMNEAADSVGLDGVGTQLHSTPLSEGESASNRSAKNEEGKVEVAVVSQEAEEDAKEAVEPDQSKIAENSGNGGLEAPSGRTDESSQSEQHGAKNEVNPIAQAAFTGVLEKLISLDPAEVFKDPVDDSFAPNYSKIIKLPMCFSMMQEKIDMHQYPSWSFFVEDFERICYNAMKYNQKRSRIWNAANSLLRQGKKVIEPLIGRGDTLVDNADVISVPNDPLEDGSQLAQNPAEGGNVIQEAEEDGFLHPAINSGQDTAANTVLDAGKDGMSDATSNALEQVGASGVVGELDVEPSAADLEKDPPPKSISSDTEGRGTRLSAGLPGFVSHRREKGNSSLRIDVSKNATAQVVTVTPDVRGSVVRRGFTNFQDGGGGVVGVAPQRRSANHVNEDVKVEILKVTGPEDIRADFKDEATECSSSFGCTKSTMDSDAEVRGLQLNGEVESELRDGNGALSSAFAEDDELAGGVDRGKEALNADWKKYRRGIEWRCRWLEIRLNELRTRADRYERLLKEKKAKKTWVLDVHPGEEYSARSAQMVDSPQSGRTLQRLPRNQVENNVDLDVYMARHPLFSRYGTDGESKYKKKKGDFGDAYVEPKIEAAHHVQNLQNTVEMERRFPEESDTEEQLILGRSSVAGQDTMEQILWKVEALQARVQKAKLLLSRGAPVQGVSPVPAIPRPPSNLLRAQPQASPRIGASPGVMPRPPGTKGRPPSGLSPGLSGTPLANGAYQRQASMRRKSSDYDINNMVMPASVGAKYVEHIKHADIWTPHWRLIDNAEEAGQSLSGSSSDEDTDDEQVQIRHSEMEINERNQRYMLPPKKSPDADPVVSGKGKSKPGKPGMGKGAGKMSARGSVPTKVTTALAVESPSSSSCPAFAGCIPKGKRRKRLFNATSFTTNHAQRLAAYLAESSSSLRGAETAVIASESIAVAAATDVVEPKISEETSDETILPETEESSRQPLESIATVDVELKRKISATSGLQVLANP